MTSTLLYLFFSLPEIQETFQESSKVKFSQREHRKVKVKGEFLEKHFLGTLLLVGEIVYYVDRQDK